MQMCRWPLVFASFLVLVLGIAPPATSGPDTVGPPSATKVVVRGKRELPDALEAATRAAWGEGAARPVLLVFDVTPYTKKARTRIEEALATLTAKAGAVPAWSVAALGSRPSKSVPSPADLGTYLGRVLAKETDVVSTMTALSKTLKGWKPKGGVVVYLADWRFEDDHDLEDFIKDLQRKKRTLSVIGTEAAFRRGWNDGLRDTLERIVQHGRGIQMKNYWEGVGRDPFANRDKKAPWHGGDTAYPYAPYRWEFLTWETMFSQSDWDSADLDLDLDDTSEAAKKRDALQAQMDEVHAELERIRAKLETCGEAERAELETERDRLQDEWLRLMREKLKTFGGEIAKRITDRMEREERIEELVKERDALREQVGEVLMKIVESDDEAECAELEKQQAELEAEVDRLTKEIEALEASDLVPEVEDTPGDPPPGGIEDPEDLRGRLPGGGKDPEGAKTPEWIDRENRYVEFPLPSSYGPYGLMRAAGVTGGRYVLFSWNPSGRKTVSYEYTRCNLFPPDLRSRKEIRDALPGNAWARGMIVAWCRITDARVDVLEHRSPLRKNLKTPQSMDRSEGGEFALRSWASHGEKKVFIRVTKRALEVVDDAARILDEALESAGEPADEVEQRYEAEALVFRHVLRVARFELSESMAAAAEVPRSAWREKEREPGVGTRFWIRPGRDPDKVRHSNIALYDPDAGKAILEERRALLRRFRGTPLGEEVAMNDVESSEPDWWENADSIPDTGRSPSESVDIPKPTPKAPGTGSGGAGPSTGGG